MSDKKDILGVPVMDPPQPVVGEEARRRIDFVEKVTGLKVVLLAKDERALVMKTNVTNEKNVEEAASCAAAIVFNDANPDGAWTVEADGYRHRLAELCGIKDLPAQAPFKPFSPVPCPLSIEERERALAYLRNAFQVDYMIESSNPAERDLAIKFIKWAKDAAS